MADSFIPPKEADAAAWMSTFAAGLSSAPGTYFISSPDAAAIQAEVNAFIQNSKVIIPLDKNDAVTEVLYGWEAYTEANLVNEANLPASTFKLKIQ